jgi:hypothetical protein
VSLLAAHARVGVYGGSKAFVLAPGAAETDFWERGGVPVYYLPKEIAMKADSEDKKDGPKKISRRHERRADLRIILHRCGF